MAGPNKSKLIPRRTVTAGQGDEKTKLNKNEIARLTALNGLLSLFMFGTDANDLFNEETSKTASIAKSMKTKAGKGLFPTLNTIAESLEPFKKSKGELYTAITSLGKNFKKYANAWMNEIKVRKLLRDIRDDIDDLVDNGINIAPIVDAIDNIDMPEFDPMFDVVIDALNIGNKDSIFGKLDDIISLLGQPATKQEQNNASKLLIEISGSTDLSKLIEQLNILGDDDIDGDTGILTKLDKLISGIKASVEKSLDIDVSKSLSNINDVNKLIDAVQAFGDTNLSNTENTLSAFSDILNKISTLKIPKQEIIKELNKFLEDTGKDTTITTLFENLNDFLRKNGVKDNGSKMSIEQLKSFNQIIEMLINISNVKTRPNIKAVEKINTLVSKNGPLPQILQNINGNLKEQVSKNAEANLKLVMCLFDTISRIADIGIIKQIRMKMNIWFIKHFLTNDIISVIASLHKSAGKIKKEQDGSIFKIFSSFIGSVIKLGEIDKRSKTKMVKNLWWIRRFIANMTTKIIEQLVESTKDIESKDTKDKVEILANFVGSLPEIADFGIKKFLKYSLKVEILRSFIRTSIQDLISEIANLEDTDEAKTSFDNVGEIIESMNDSLDKLASFKKILSYVIKVSTINDLIMTQLIRYGDYTILLQSIIESIDNAELARLSSIITNINDSLENFKKVDYVKIYDNIIAGIDSLIQLNKFTDTLLKIGKNAKDIDPESIKNIKIIVDKIGDINFGVLSNAISKSLDTAKFFKNIEPLIKGANTIAKLGLVESALEKGANGINKMIDKLIEGIHKFDDVNQQSIDNATKTIDIFMQLVIKSAAIMILGSLAMMVIDAKNLIVFTLSLTAFIVGIGYALKCAASIVADSSETIDAFGTLIVKSALVLILGSMVFTFLNAADVLGFAIILTGFIFGISYAYKIAASSVKESMESAKDFSELVLVSGYVLILGSIVTHYVTKEDIATFTGLLLAFIAGTMAIYVWASKHMEKAIEGLHDFTIMIVASGLVLALGSLITQSVAFTDILTFGLMLGLFIWGTMSIYTRASKKMGKAVEGLRDFTIMIVASGILLMVGSLLTKKVGIESVITFTGMLALFIGVTMLTYTLASKYADDAIKGLREFGIMVIASGILLMVGSLLTKKVGIESVITFTGMLALFIGVTMLVYVLASNFMGDAMKGLREFGIMVIASGILLMVGALIVAKVGWEPVALFGAMLALFVGGLMLIYIKASKHMGKAIKGAGEFGVLVLLSGFALMLGALVVDKVGLEPVAEFGLILFLFVGGLMLIYTKFGKKIKKSIPSAAALGTVAMLSSIALGIGMIFMEKYPNGADRIWSFVLAELILIGGLAIIYSKFGKKIKKAIPAAAAMSAVSVLSSAALAVGMMFMEKYPNGADKIWDFVLADLVLVGGFALILKYLGKIKKSVAIQGTILLGIIVGLAAISALIIGKIASIGDKYDLNKTWIVIGQIATVIGGLVVFAVGLGAFAVGGGALLIGAGVAILSTIVSIAMLAAKAMEAIAEAMIAMQSVKKFDPKPIIEGVKSFVEIAKELKPLADDALIIMIASNAIRSLKYVLSDISQAVKEYAELKIPIYEGTKEVGYRQLDKKDFKSAANNVKIIIETLGGAVIDAYEKNPDIFAFELFGGSPFARVTKSLKTLAPMLSEIARAVKDYASLKIPIYTGTKLTGYDSLKQQNFKEAGDNVKLIIETLGGAVMASYDAHPDMFETNFWGNSPFSKVTRSLKTLGPMLSRIAKSVKDYASLLIPNYGNGTKIVKYDKLTNQHFKDAANNVKLIIETLGGAIIKVYEAHPDYYATSGGFLGFGATSPFTRTVSANMKLAKLISKISRSVRDFASSRVPIKWDNKGNAVEYETLTQKHFDAANKAIVAVITTLGNAVLESGKKMEEIGGPKQFKKVVNAQAKLGDLISKISKSVLHFAQGKVPTGFNAKNGEPTGYEPLGEKHFRAASNSVIAVITTLGGAVMKAGEEMERTLPPKEFKKVVEAESKLGNLISTISESVLNFANGKVPIGYKEDGTAKGYEPLGEKHFISASNAIQKVITTLGQSIIDSYEQHGEWFDDGEDSKFAMACKAIGSMGTMISSIAAGMQAYADMKIPLYNAKGEITGYKPIDDDVLVNASKTIAKIITNLGQTIMNEYDAHNDWFDDGPESQMAMAAAAIGSMGSMLSSVAEGIQSYANLMIPDKWDEKGNPIHFTKMKDQDFIDAGNNVGKIVSLLGKTIINLYNGKDYEGKNLPGLENAKEMFTFDPEVQKDSPFNNVLNSCMKMGEMITSISEGVQSYALLNMPIEFDSEGKPTKFKKMDPGMFGEAAKNIGLVISTIGGAIMTAFGAHKDWFELPAMKTNMIVGFFGLSKESPNPGDPPFMKVMKSLSLMGAVITSIATGVQVFASGRVPKYDESGKIIGYDPMDDTVFTAAATAISSVITIMGNTFETVYTKHNRLFIGDTAKKVTDATLKMGLTINAIASAIQTYANLKYPTAWNENGKPISFQKMSKTDFEDAAKTIKTVITTIAEAITEASDHRVFADASISVLGLIKASTGNKVVNMLNAIQKTSTVLSSLSSTIQQYANLKYAIAWDTKGKPIAWKRFDKQDFTNSAESIKKVITHIASAIVEAVDGNEKIFGQNILQSPAYTAAMAVGKMGEALNVIAQSISYYAKSEFPVITWNNGKATTKIYKLNPTDYDDAKTAIRTVILCVAETIDSIYKAYPELFDIKVGSAIDNIKNGVSVTNTIIQTLSKQIEEIAKVDFSSFVQSLSGESDSLKSAIDILANMFNAMQYGSKTTIKTESARNILNPLFALQDGTSIRKIFDQMPQALGTMGAVVKSLLDTVSTISNQFTLQKDSIESLQVESINGVIDKIINIFNKINELQNKLSGGDEESIGLFSKDKAKLIIKDILSIQDVVLAVLDSLKLWQDNIHGLADVSLEDSIIAVLNGYQRVAELAKSINSSLNSTDEGAASSLQGWFSGLMGDDEGTAFGNINALNASLIDLIEIAANAEQYGLNGYNTIKEGIETIQNAINKIQGIQTFAQHREILGKYVNTINGLDIKKMNSMTNFVNAMNKLAYKMGNLDKLTLAIANNLTSVLEKLTVRMEDAKTTILKSEELQDKRQKRLEETILHIKEIMSQKLIIEISNVDDTKDDVTPETPEGGKKDQKPRGGTKVGEGGEGNLQDTSMAGAAGGGSNTLPESTTASDKSAQEQSAQETSQLMKFNPASIHDAALFGKFNQLLNLVNETNETLSY